MKTKNSRLLPILFTVSYFGTAFLFPVYDPMVTALFDTSFSNIQTILARLLLSGMAVLASVLLWTFQRFWIERFSRRQVELLPIGLLLPVVIFAVPSWMAHHRQLASMARDERMRQEVQLIDLHDEELATTAGNPIGVRLRYRVRFPEGPAVIEGPAAMVSSIPSADLSGIPASPSRQDESGPGQFHVRKSEGRALNATDAEMVVEIVPRFMPVFLQNPLTSPGTAGMDPCIKWGPGSVTRQDILNSGPQTFRILVGILHGYATQTRQRYDMRRFYEGALKEGARECSQ